MKKLDLTGQEFGRLTAIKSLPNTGHNTPWLCKCVCGGETIATSYNLRSGHTTSCGCFHKETVSKNFKTHGLSRSPIYTTWKLMMQRCYNVNNKNYKDYGQRGITVCQEWHSFDNFFNDMGSRPKKFTIERINNNGNYEPSNCKWVSRLEQACNRRNSNLLTFRGQTFCISQWARITGISQKTIWKRVYSYEWPVEKALTTPVRKVRGGLSARPG